MLLFKLQIAAQTIVIWSIDDLKARDITPFRILKLFKRPMALSTSVLALAIRLVWVVWRFDNGLPFLKGGAFSVHPLTASKSLIVKPGSDITSSPEVSLSKNPDLSVISLSDVRPEYNSHKNVKAPFGEIAINCLKVFECL